MAKCRITQTLLHNIIGTLVFWCHCQLIISCFIKIQIGLVFLVPAYPGCPGKEAAKWVSACLFQKNAVKKRIYSMKQSALLLLRILSKFTLCDLFYNTDWRLLYNTIRKATGTKASVSVTSSLVLCRHCGESVDATLSASECIVSLWLVDRHCWRLVTECQWVYCVAVAGW